MAFFFFFVRLLFASAAFFTLSLAPGRCSSRQPMAHGSSVYDVQYTALIDACIAGDADAARRELLANAEWVNTLMESAENKRARQAMWGRLVALLACITIAVLVCVLLIPHGSTKDVLTAVFIAIIVLAAAAAMIVKLRQAYVMLDGTRAGTPLHHAIRAERVSVVLALLALHPNLSMRDHYGRTALEAAQLSGLRAIETLIIDEAAWQDRPPEYAADSRPPVRYFEARLLLLSLLYLLVYLLLSTSY